MASDRGGRYDQYFTGMSLTEYTALDELRLHDHDGKPESWRKFYVRAIPILQKEMKPENKEV